MSEIVDKLAILHALIISVEDTLARAKLARQSSQKDANEAPGAMISRYDSAKEESQYLAGAQQLREKVIGHGLTSLKLFKRELGKIQTANKAVIGALVHLDFEGKQTWVFLAPYGGGTVLKVNEINVLVVTKESPLGRALWGLEEGDTACLKKGQQIQEFEIVNIC